MSTNFHPCILKGKQNKTDQKWHIIMVLKITCKKVEQFCPMRETELPLFSVIPREKFFIQNRMCEDACKK